jgi:hypothetical protein
LQNLYKRNGDEYEKNDDDDDVDRLGVFAIGGSYSVGESE